MFMDTTGIDLFDQNICMICAEVRVTCSWLSLVLIYLIKMQVWWANKLSQIHMDITGIDLFDQNVGMKCADVRLRCLSISVVLIYLIKM